MYSNSKLVDERRLLSGNYNPRRSNDRIRKITIHHMAGNLTLQRCFEVLSSRNASYNYGISTNGRVGLFVEEKNRSWASSNAANDYQAVTISLANNKGAPNWEVSDEALNKCIELVVDVCKRNGIDKLNYTGNANGNLTIHQFFSATACPGNYLKSKMNYIQNEVNKRLSGGYIVKRGDVLWKIAEKYDLTWQELAKYNNLTDTQASNLRIGQVLNIPPIDDFKTPTSDKDLLECHNTKIELTNEIDALKQQIKAHKEDITSLENKISDLQAHNDELKEEIKQIPEMPKFIFKSQRTDNYIIYLPKGIELYIKKD